MYDVINIILVRSLQIKDSTSYLIEYCMDLRSDTNALVLLVVGIFSVSAIACSLQ